MDMTCCAMLCCVTDIVSMDHVCPNELPRLSLSQLAARCHCHADNVRHDHGQSLQSVHFS